jgi:CRP/FNR family transcriptional regulator, cyclic AMP receptor protein
MQLKREWANRFLDACKFLRITRRQLLTSGSPVYVARPEGRCWIVRSGYVKLLDSTGDGETFVRLFLGRGGLFGDPPFGATAFGGFTAPQHEQAIAHGALEVIELDRGELESMARTQAAFSVMLIESATTQLQFLERRLLWQSMTPVRVRIAATLRDLICFEGQHCRHGRAIDVRLTHQDLSELVGAARPVVSDHLTRLRDEGAISYTRSYFCVDNLSELIRIAAETHAD